MLHLKKALFLLASALVITSLTCSCDNDENDGDGDENQNSKELSMLNGTWEEVNRESYKDGKIIPDHWSKWAKWAFKKDGVLVHFSKTYTDKGTYEYNAKEKKLRLKYYGENYSCEIITLTDKELAWKKNYPDDEYDYQILYLEKISSEYDE